MVRNGRDRDGKRPVDFKDMKSGVCPKCGSDAVYVDKGQRHVLRIMVQSLSNLQTHLYICADCGFIEFYALQGFDLSEVSKKFEKVVR